MDGLPHPISRTVEEVFNDFKGRRAGLIKALTSGFIFFLCFSYLLLFSVFLLSLHLNTPLFISALIFRVSCFFFIRLILIYFWQISFLGLLVLTVFFLIFFCTDVEKFYQQCDPGGLSHFVFFVCFLDGIVGNFIVTFFSYNVTYPVNVLSTRCAKWVMPLVFKRILSTEPAHAYNGSFAAFSLLFWLHIFSFWFHF